MKIIGLTLIFYALLVAPHEGEFWPFSIYPMFSQAGNPWTRAMIMDVTELPDNELWETHSLQEMKGQAIPVKNYGVDQIDFSNFVSKTSDWTIPRRQALRTMFGTESLQDRRWMATRVQGKLVGQDSVVVEVVPFLLLTADSVYIHPEYEQTQTFTGDSQ